jgi:hypothetical protein
MRYGSTRATALALLVLATCTIPGPVGQLDSFKKQEAAGQFATIANATVSSDCGSASPSDACPQLHEIHGRACLRMAREESAAAAACPGPSAQRWLDCAAGDFKQAEASRSFSPDQMIGIRDNRARALYCGASLRGPQEGQAMASEADQELEGLPATAGRKQLAASTAMFTAVRPAFPAAQRCAAARQALARAQDGLRLPADPAMTQELQRIAANATDLIARIPCGNT